MQTMGLSDALDAAKKQYEELHGSIGEPTVDADSTLALLRRAFEAGVTWGVNYWTPMQGPDMVDRAFEYYMMAELSNALQAQGVDVGDIDRAVLGTF